MPLTGVEMHNPKTRPPLSFGIYLPNVGWDAIPSARQMMAYAVDAEAAGFDSVWVEDRLLHPDIDILEAVTTLSFVASCTSRVQLGTSVLLLNLRNPIPLAKSLSTLNHLSDGRLVVGASLGGHPQEYETSGISTRTRVSRFLNTVDLLRSFWGQRTYGTVDIPSVVAGSMTPRPGESPIPILIGGRVDAALRRAAMIGDGWLASSTTTAEVFRRSWETIVGHTVDFGRDPATLIPAKFCYIDVDDSEERALSRLESRLPRYYGRPYDVESLALYGPPAKCVDGAMRLLEAGVRTLIFATVTSDHAQLHKIAEEILPVLRKEGA